MAGGKIVTRKLPASTILEVIVALVVLMIVFAIALTIFGNVFRLSLSVKKIKAQAELQDILNSTVQAKNYTDDSFMVEEFKIIKEIKPVEDEPSLSLLNLTALDVNGQKVAEIKQLVINDYEQP